MRYLCANLVWVIVAVVACTAQNRASVSPIELELKPGEVFAFTVKLNKPPDFSDGSIQYAVIPPTGVGAFLNPCGSTVPGQSVYHCEYKVPMSAPGGTWQIARIELWTVGRQIVLYSSPIHFTVSANENLSLADSADVTVNPSQTQLLRTETKSVQHQLQTLKAMLSALPDFRSEARAIPILQNSVNEAIDGLTKTQREFKRLAKSPDQNSLSDIFFGDIRNSYEEVLKDVVSARISNTFVFANAAFPTSPGPKYPLLAQAVFRAFEKNLGSYQAVADSESLLFDLEVNSIPEGAAVFYFRQGDDPKLHPAPTNSTIKSLAYARWFVRFEKTGYRTEEREHDPGREPNHVITVGLHH